jgi:TatA/E family protein of Tat protein translocase
MFGLGFTEILVILVVALLVFGPDRLPELARSLGKGLAEFRRASSDLRRSMMDVAEEPKLRPTPPPALPPAAGPADEAAAAPLATSPNAPSERDPGGA